MKLILQAIKALFRKIEASIDNAQTAADNAKSAADNAKSLADNSKATADNAYTIANSAQATADNAQTAADNAQTTADSKMSVTNPVGSGTFSMGRKSGSTVGSHSHAEGFVTTASGAYSHAEGYTTTAAGAYSHAEGSYTTASGANSHAEGNSAKASGDYSHAEGYYTKAQRRSQHVYGEYNIEDAGASSVRGKYVQIVGNGTSSKLSNAHTLDWEGNAWFAGDVYVGSTSGTNKDDGSKKLATEDYVNNNVDATLTQSGQAADAAAVGEQLSSLSGKIVQADWNQNDSTAADYVMNRTHYEEYAYSDFICSMETPIEGFTMPNVGESVTVKVDGVEMDYPVLNDVDFTYFGTGDLDTVLDSGGWIVISNSIDTFAFANPDTTISLKVNKIHKLDDKFINIGGFVRRYDYLFGYENIISERFNAKGKSILLYKCEKFIKPNRGEMIFGYMSDLAFSEIGIIKDHACFISAYVYQSVLDDNGNTVTHLNTTQAVLGTDETEMIEIANGYGYKFTEPPKNINPS